MGFWVKRKTNFKRVNDRFSVSGLFRCMVIANVDEELRARVPAAVDTGRNREAILLLHDEGLGLSIPERNYKIKQNKDLEIRDMLCVASKRMNYSGVKKSDLVEIFLKLMIAS